MSCRIPSVVQRPWWIPPAVQRPVWSYQCGVRIRKRWFVRVRQSHCQPQRRRRWCRRSAVFQPKSIPVRGRKSDVHHGARRNFVGGFAVALVPTPKAGWRLFQLFHERRTTTTIALGRDPKPTYHVGSAYL